MKTISCPQPEPNRLMNKEFTKNWLSNFDLIKEIMDMSHELAAFGQIFYAF
jgi:hypothetical protein